MNNPEDFPIDVQEMREWIMAYRTERGLSWPRMAEITGIARGTLSPFATGVYQGNNEFVARKVFQFKQMIESQEERGAGLPDEPAFILTPTAQRLRALLIEAHAGNMTLFAGGPGTSKTITAQDYAASASNVWVVTCKPTAKSMAGMLAETLRAMGGTPRQSWTRQMSADIKNMVSGRRGLLIYDEANHLDWECMEEIRDWNDTVAVGVCFLGNEELVTRVTSGQRRHAFARLNSRISMRHEQDMPLDGDVEAYLDGWDIQDDQIRAVLKRVALTGGSGGLREVRQIIRTASMLARDEDRTLSFGDVRDALSTRATRYIRMAA